jgi:hypothetical protein
MKSKILKSILALILLSASPFIVLSIVGTLYVILQMIGGLSFTAGVQSRVIMHVVMISRASEKLSK